ncbi:hypothetical protein [Methylobacterium sp. WL9]|uniref:hypothetical protein n=1 Tax=Methylobacterium sp. WL9 TaxID=2603898 RepID=UPI0011C96B88|nr:hypothetical protein [Methylobacterium sp. WL9]TXN22861.1 hypothetical protein FV217_09065 [Methylobacterium sp. WL9]
MPTSTPGTSAINGRHAQTERPGAAGDVGKDSPPPAGEWRTTHLPEPNPKLCRSLDPFRINSDAAPKNNEMRTPIRKSLFAAAILATLSAASIVPASAAPGMIGAVDAPTAVTEVRMDGHRGHSRMMGHHHMRGHMMRHHHHRGHMMRHGHGHRHHRM